jgi:hypothetical protein
VWLCPECHDWWFHHFCLRTKQQSLEWHYSTSQKKQKARTVPPFGKDMETLLCYTKEVHTVMVDMKAREDSLNDTLCVLNYQPFVTLKDCVRSHH